MPGTSNEEQNQDAERQLKTIRQREAFNNAYASLVAQQSVQSFTAFTFEEALDQNIERIEGEGTELHPNQLVRVQRIKDNVLQAIEEVRQVDPEEFRLKDSTQDVNTPQEGV